MRVPLAPARHERISTEQEKIRIDIVTRERSAVKRSANVAGNLAFVGLRRPWKAS
jgi:hypothetical protein